MHVTFKSHDSPAHPFTGHLQIKLQDAGWYVQLIAADIIY